MLAKHILDSSVTWRFLFSDSISSVERKETSSFGQSVHSVPGLFETGTEGRLKADDREFVVCSVVVPHGVRPLAVLKTGTGDGWLCDEEECGLAPCGVFSLVKH